jgi:hypothetical protein
VDVITTPPAGSSTIKDVHLRLGDPGRTFTRFQPSDHPGGGQRERRVLPAGRGAAGVRGWENRRISRLHGRHRTPRLLCEKPKEWVGRRTSPGQVQEAISAVIAAQRGVCATSINDTYGDLGVIDKTVQVFRAARWTTTTTPASSKIGLVSLRSRCCPEDQVCQRPLPRRTWTTPRRTSSTRNVVDHRRIPHRADCRCGGRWAIMTSAGRSALHGGGFRAGGQ